MNAIVKLLCPTCDSEESIEIPFKEQVGDDSIYEAIADFRVKATSMAFDRQKLIGWSYETTKDKHTGAPIGRYFCPSCLRQMKHKDDKTRADPTTLIVQQIDLMSYYLQALSGLSEWKEIDTIHVSEIGAKVVAKKKSSEGRIPIRCTCTCFICRAEAQLVTMVPASSTEQEWAKAAVNRFYGAHWKTAEGISAAGKPIVSWFCGLCNKLARDLWREPAVENLVSFTRIRDGNLTERHKAGVEVCDPGKPSDVQRYGVFPQHVNPAPYLGYNNNTRYGTTVVEKPPEVIYEGLNRYRSDDEIPEFDEEAEADVFGLKNLPPANAVPVGP